MSFFRYFDAQDNWFPVVVEDSMLFFHLENNNKCECDAHELARTVGGYKTVTQQSALNYAEQGRYASISQMLEIVLNL